MDISQIESLVSDCIRIDRHETTLRFLIFYGTLLRESKEAFETIKNRLKPLELVPFLRSSGEEVELRIATLRKISPVRPIVHLVLFLTTVATTILAGALLAKGAPFLSLRVYFLKVVEILRHPADLLSGIPFSFTLLLILGSHEFGHYFACKRLGIKATLPYFIPLPPPIILGTMGAVIRIKSPIENKQSLLEVGAAGPLVGVILAVPITIIGLKLSSLIPVAEVAGKPSFFVGSSIIFSLFMKLFARIPQGYTLSLHPVAFSGWVGLFVTSLNLLPIGQLDGGHIAYALFGKAHRFIAWSAIGMLFILGIFWPGFILFAFIVLSLGVRHPPPLNDITSLDNRHKMLGWISILVFVITFVPTPFGVTV